MARDITASEVTSYFTALGLTIVIELPIFVVALGRWAQTGWRESACFGVAVNFVSHPIAFLAIYPAIDHLAGDVAALTVTEVLVAVGEAALLVVRATPPSVALAVSGCANVASLVIGTALVR